MRLALAFTLALLCLPAMSQEPAPNPIMQGAVDGVIRPAIVGFGREASGLASAMDLLCAVPSQQALELAEHQFGETVLAYARIELVRLGPLMEDNRSERLLAWPDMDDVGLRQVEAVLASKDETAANPATLREQDVAVQGLPALEYVLFGPDAETLAEGDDGYRCRYGLAIAKAVAGVGQELATGWFRPDGVAQRLMLPDAGNADYRTALEATGALVSVLAFGLETVRVSRIEPFISGDAEAERAPFWRSGLTVEMLRANLNGLRDLFTVSGLAGPEYRGLANSIEFEFRNADRALNLVTLPLDKALADDRQAHALDYLMIVIGSLQTMIAGQLASALGVELAATEAG